MRIVQIGVLHYSDTNQLVNMVRVFTWIARILLNQMEICDSISGMILRAASTVTVLITVEWRERPDVTQNHKTKAWN